MTSLVKTAVIDADHIFFLSLTGEKVLDSFGLPVKEDGKFTYTERTFERSCEVADNYIRHLLAVTGSSHYIGIFGGSSKSRININPDYKANRKHLEPLKNLTEMKNHLNSKWKFHWMSGCIDETDDYVASIIKQVPNTFIISPDKDLLGLEGTHYNPKRNEWVTTTKEQAEYHFWKSMICGDTADNIKGLPGKGEKAWEEWTQDITHFDYLAYGRITYEMYVQHYDYNWDKVLEEFYKNYHCLKLKNNLIIDTLTSIEWSSIMSDLDFDIN